MLEKLLTEWVEHTSGEYQIISKDGQEITGRFMTTSTVPRTATAQAVIVTRFSPTYRSTISSPLAVLSGSKAHSISRSMTYSQGLVEVRATIKNVAAFSILLDGSDIDRHGSIIKVTCSSINSASSS